MEHAFSLMMADLAHCRAAVRPVSACCCVSSVRVSMEDLAVAVRELRRAQAVQAAELEQQQTVCAAGEVRWLRKCRVRVGSNLPGE